MAHQAAPTGGSCSSDGHGTSSWPSARGGIPCMRADTGNACRFGALGHFCARRHHGRSRVSRASARSQSPRQSAPRGPGQETPPRVFRVALRRAHGHGRRSRAAAAWPRFGERWSRAEATPGERSAQRESFRRVGSGIVSGRAISSSSSWRPSSRRGTCEVLLATGESNGVNRVSRVRGVAERLHRH